MVGTALTIEGHLLVWRQPVREVLIVLVVVVVVFLVGFFWPGRSRRLQERVKEKASAERDKSRHRAGKLGDWAATSIDKSRWVTERSVHAGRKAHDKTFRSERGAHEEQDLKKKYGEGAERGEAPSDQEPRDGQ
jgi:FtsZ-interacting cell division protein ZipA